MSRFTFTGPVPQTYPQHIDVDKGSTLVAEPGGTYEIAQVEGHTVPGEPDESGGCEPVPVELPMPPDDRWKAETRTRARRDNEETS